MKKTKFKLSIVTIVSLLLIVSFMSTESVQGQDYSYPTDLAVGNSYEWEIADFSTLGSVSTSFLDFGDDVLEFGDVFSIKLIGDINDITNGTPSELLNPSNIWAEFYLNDEFKTNETDQIGLLDLGWLSLMPIGQDNFFLQPTTYENVTDAYNYFEILDENFPQYTLTHEDIVESHGYSNHHTTKVKITSKLTSKSWTIKYQYEETETEDDLLDSMSWQKLYETTTRYIEIRFSVKMGFVTYIDYQTAWHQERTVEGSVDIDDNSVILLIKSKDLPTGAPFDWGYSIIGIAVVSLIVYKRKRR
jgi:hypothetical protein